MKDLGCITWFAEWLIYHQSLHRSQLWPSIDTVDGVEYFEGWIEAFDRIGATMGAARAASRRMQDGPRLMPFEHLGVLTRLIRELLNTGLPTGGSTPRDELSAARGRSMDCPECRGTGWALRPALYAGPPERRISVSLYCRCAYGRLLLRGDWEDRGKEISNDDLQARPELWQPELSHPTWSPIAEPALVTILGPDSPEGRYVRPEDKKTGLRDRPPRHPGDRPSQHQRSLMSDCTRGVNP